ncbi:tetratricopeptide repeat protein [Maribacter spongiicola]|uniref:tetratricopeptide repeat protein n=1 Tax=Maribacter spongiicola TaxID=1206753 RepID=UPI003F97EF4D
MNIIGYIILGFAVLLTLGWCLRIREKAKIEQKREKAMELQGFLMTVSIILIAVLEISPFHLFWMFPASFIIGLLSASTPLRILWYFSSIYFSFWYIGINNLGRKFYLEGEYDKSIDAFEKQIIKNPNSVEDHFYLGLAYGKARLYEKEIESYKKALKLRPNRPEFYFNLSNAYYEIGNNSKAIDALKKAIELRPDYMKAHYGISKIYSEIGENEKAYEEYEKVKKLDSNIAEKLAILISNK